MQLTLYRLRILIATDEEATMNNIISRNLNVEKLANISSLDSASYLSNGNINTMIKLKIIMLKRPPKYDMTDASFFLIGALCYSNNSIALYFFPLVKCSAKNSITSLVCLLTFFLEENVYILIYSLNFLSRMLSLSTKKLFINFSRILKLSVFNFTAEEQFHLSQRKH